MKETVAVLCILSLLVPVFVIPPAVFAQVDTSREDLLLKSAQDYIENNRKGSGRIQLIDKATGKSLSGTDVQYQQVTHDFMLSNILYSEPVRMKWLGLEWSGDLWLSWSEIQPTKESYNYSIPDYWIKRLQRPAGRIYARFSGLFFDWNYLTSPKPPSFADLDHINDAAVFARYKDLIYAFVFNVAKRYKGTISAYCTQMEVNWPGHGIYKGFYKQPLWTVEQAVEVNKVVSKAIRDADPKAIIILGTSTTWQGPGRNDVNPLEFTRLCLASGVDADMVGLEVYPFDGSPAFFYDYIKELAKLGKPVFIEETGAPSVKPDGDVSNWKWRIFDEHAQALWYKYIITLAFGMKEVTGVNNLILRDAEPSVYSTLVSNVFDPMGLYTLAWQPKEAAMMVHDLIANFTSSGTGRTDSNGVFAFRGFAGNYSITITTNEGLAQVFQLHIGEAEDNSFTLEFDRTQAIGSVRTTLSKAEKSLSWAKAVGKKLDIPKVDRMLDDAKLAFDSADYGKARINANAILEMCLMKMDGSPVDWEGIPESVTDASDDAKVEGTDILSLRGVMDDEYLYIMLRVSGRIKNDAAFAFDIDTNNDGRGDYGVRLQIDMSGWTGGIGAQTISQNPEYGWADIIEVKIPLGLMRNPATVKVLALSITSNTLVRQTGLSDQTAWGTITAQKITTSATSPTRLTTATTPTVTSSSLETYSIYIGIAIVAAAVISLFIAKKRKGKSLTAK